MKRWTKEDVQYLEESWGNVSIGKICENLNRTRYAINNKVNRLGLGKFTDNHSQGWVSYNAVLDLMGITQSKGYSYISFIQKRGLPIHRLRRDKAKIIMVNIKEFWEWAEKNQHSLDFSKLERYSFGPEPQWVDIKRQRDISKVKNINHGKWTKAEDEYLLMLLRQYRYTWREISLKLNRTYGAVQRRIVDLGYKERPIRESYSSKWSPEQVELLKLMVKNGNNYFEINKVINKSEKAIRGKVYILYGSENLDKARATKIEEEKMKAKLTPTKAQIERVNQQVWQHCLDSLSDDLAVDLIVLHQSFGFGEKRIRQFLEEKKNLTRRVEGYGNDDIKKEKIDEMLSEFGIAHDEIYFKEDMKQYVHERKVQERVSLKESIEIQRDLEIMKSLIGV